MSDRLMIAGRAAGSSVSAGSTVYCSSSGYLYFSTVEDDVEFISRSSCTLYRMAINVTQNNLSGSTTVRSRKNGANGNQVITVAAGETGTFQDLTHTDSLLDGSTFNTRVITAAGTGTITFTVISYLLDGESILGGTVNLQQNFGETWFTDVWSNNAVTATETNAKYTFRSACTLSHLRVYVDANTVDGTTTIRTRINGINGSQTVSVTASAVGTFEDIINSDTVSAGNTVDLQIVTGGTTGQISIRLIHVKQSVNRILAFGYVAGQELSGGTTQYYPCEGDTATPCTTESQVQIPARTDYKGKNLFVRIITNTLTGTAVFRTRINGAYNNLVVSVLAGTTGAFEDTISEDLVGSADLVDLEVITLGTGSIIFTLIGFEQQVLTVPGTTIPIKGGIGFNQPIFGDYPDVSWEYVSADIMDVNIKRGRMHELDRIEAGTAILTLKNTTGNYWRYNTASPYYAIGGFHPLLRVHLSSEYEGTTYHLFDGVVESIKPGWVDDRGGTTSIMTVQCVDLFKAFTRLFVFGTLQTPVGTFPSQLSSARINAVLDEMGWPDTATSRSIDTGKVTVQALTPPVGGTNAMEHLFDVAKAEGGLIFIDGLGRVVFQNRDARISSTSSATFSDASDSHYVMPELYDDDTFIYNEARIKGTSIAEQVYYDSTAMTNQGERAWVVSDSQIKNDADAFEQAYLIVSRYSDSKLRCQNLLFMPSANVSDLFPKALGYEISTHIKLQLDNTYNPLALGASGLEYHIEGIEHEYHADTNLWQTKWQLWDVNQYRIFRVDKTTGHGDYVVNSNANYTTCHDAASGSTAYNDQATLVVGQSNQASVYAIDRGFIQVDTTNLLVTDTIVSAILLMKDVGTTIDAPFDLTVVNPGAVTDPIDTGDYSLLIGSATDCGHIGSGDITNGGWFAITLDASGIALINKGSTTYFGLLSSKDISATAPLPGINEFIGIEGADSSYVPRLIVQVTHS